MTEIKPIRIKMTLVKPARKSGGDRYHGKYENEDVDLYWPQKISRATSGGVTPAQELIVEVSHG